MAELGKWMTVREGPGTPGRRTLQWIVEDQHGGYLGIIEWYSRWRCYTFIPGHRTTFNAGCLDELAQFCRDHHADRRPA